MPAAQIAHGAKPRGFKGRQILIGQPVQRIGPEQHPMAQRLPLMPAPAAEVAEVGCTFKRDKAGQLLGHGRNMAESTANAHGAALFHVAQNYFRRHTAFATWD